MSAGRGQWTNELGVAGEEELGTRPAGRLRDRNHGRWAFRGAKGARGTAGLSRRDRRRDWPSTRSRAGVPAGSARARDCERGASEEPGSRRPLQGCPPGSREDREEHTWGAVTPPGTFREPGRVHRGRRTSPGSTTGGQGRLGPAPRRPWMAELPPRRPPRRRSG